MSEIEKMSIKEIEEYLEKRKTKDIIMIQKINGVQRLEKRFSDAQELRNFCRRKSTFGFFNNDLIKEVIITIQKGVRR